MSLLKGGVKGQEVKKAVFTDFFFDDLVKVIQFNSNIHERVIFDQHSVIF